MKKLLLIIAILTAFAVRFYKLDTIPAINADEAAIAYNAYSIIETGKDEHGNFMPLAFQSFNDYKPGLYFYVVAPFVKVLGMNAWAVRLPGAFLGVLSVALLYLILEEAGRVEKSEWLRKVSIPATILLSVSPWHIHFSRGGWEVNVASFFMLAMVYFFFKFQNTEKPLHLFLSPFFALLAMYTYHSARLIAPLLGLGLLVLYRKTVINVRPKVLVLILLASLLISIPLVKDMVSSGSSRLTGVGIFADVGPLNRVNEQRGEHASLTSIVGKVLHNKFGNYTLAILNNWGKHYWGEFLFLSGDDIQRNKVPETGVMLMIDFVFVIIGIALLLRSLNKFEKFILYWLIIAPIPAALTFQSPHALRAQNMVFPLIILSAYGLVFLLQTARESKSMIIKRIAPLVLIAILEISVWRYLHMYYTHMAKEYPYSSQYGVKEAVDYIKANGDKYDKIVVTDRYDQPYILFLFYLNYPPNKFQGNHELTQRDRFNFSTVNSFDKYVFKSINYDEDRVSYKNSLILGTPDEIPKEANIVKKIQGTNGHDYFWVVAN